MASSIDEKLPPGVPPVTYAPREPRLRRPPFMFIAGGIVLVVLSWVPLVLFARGRVEQTQNPRIALVQDMGTQPKYREQQTSEIFADGRADRPHIPGTVARGGVQEDDHYYRGYTRTTGEGGKPVITFLQGFPKQLKVDQKFIERGQQRFNIYCSACHGLDGYGLGQVEMRSKELGMELNVKSLQDADVRARPDGHIFNTITNGIRGMPPYSAQIPVEDRWRIISYVRALQLSQNVPPTVGDAFPAKIQETVTQNAQPPSPASR
jgi:mono/diheme cytochrome c family protein